MIDCAKASTASSPYAARKGVEARGLAAVCGGESVHVPEAQTSLFKSSAHDAHRLLGQIEGVLIVEPGECRGVDQLLQGRPTEDDIEPFRGSGVNDTQGGLR